MAKDLNCQLADLIGQKELAQRIQLERYIDQHIGLLSLNDILKELEKPGRDPRKKVSVITFDQRITTINDVQVGMLLDGIVTNITNFGVFVDIGIKENGLVHISQLANSYVSDPSTIVSLHQAVQVKVIQVDTEKKRIQLSMKTGE